MMALSNVANELRMVAVALNSVAYPLRSVAER